MPTSTITTGTHLYVAACIATALLWSPALAQAQPASPATNQPTEPAPAAAGAEAPSALPRPGEATPSAGQTEVPIVELITMGPGELLWERYGHAALCVRYRDPRRDRCYNYGTTDFSDPVSLVWEFLRGRSLFWVAATHPTRMLRFYRDRLDRSLWVQRLPLSPEKALQAAQLLADGVREENKYYKYHHYDDNCSTRVRDIVDIITDGALSQSTAPYAYTLREITRRGMAEYSILVLLSDFALGRGGDRYPNMYEAMHLPFVLRAEVEERLQVAPVSLYEREGRSFNVTDPPSRWWLALVAFAIGVPALITRSLGRYQRLGLALSVLPGGILAVIIWTMAAISTLPEVRYNEALLVIWPFDLLLPFLSPSLRVRYARARLTVVVLLLLLMVIGVVKQPIWAMALLVILPCLAAAFPSRSVR